VVKIEKELGNTKCEMCEQETAVGIIEGKYLCNYCFTRYKQQLRWNEFPPSYKKRFAESRTFEELAIEVRQNGR